ncbi:MAG: hypothetical protein V8Q85_01060 [Christensenellales bacterium]
MRFAPIEINEAQAIYRRHMAELDEFIRIIEHGFIYRHRPYYAQLTAWLRRYCGRNSVTGIIIHNILLHEGDINHV